ncbi:MAG: hypothetical protein WAJ96_05580 [Candidatus Acidiferrum sp.]
MRLRNGLSKEVRLTSRTSLALPLGDRACLALALALKLPAYTADKSWKKLKLRVRINVIR